MSGDRVGPSGRWKGWRVDPTGRTVTQAGGRLADVAAASAPVTVRAMPEADRLWRWVEPAYRSACAGCGVVSTGDTVARCLSLGIDYCEDCADARGIVPQ